jgi:hypothetical protein
VSRFVAGTYRVARSIVGAIVYGTQGIALAHPLSIVLAASLIPLEVNWRWFIFAALVGIASVTSYMASALYTVEIQRLRGIAEFKKQYGRSTFVRMKVSDYLPTLQRPRAPALTPVALMREPSSAMFYGLQPRTSLADDDSVQIFHVERNATAGGPVASSLVAFPGMTETSIFTDDAPDAIDGVRRFMMLHEIGHATWSGRTQNILAHIGALVPLAAIPFLLAAIPLSIISVATIGALGAISLSVHRGERYKNLRRSHLYDEVAADCFALHHCDPAWLAAPPEQLARLLSNDLSMSDEERRTRARILTENLYRLQRGEPPKHPMKDTIPDTQLHEFLIPTLLIVCGLLHGPLTATRLAILGILTLGFVVLCMFCYLACDFVAARLGVGKPGNIFVEKFAPVPATG